MPPRRARTRRIPLLARLGLLLGAWRLHAAEPPPSAAAAENFEFVELPVFIVEGVHERPERRGLGHGAVTVSPVASLTGALAATPGLVLQESGDGFYPPRITVRGSGLQSAPVSRGLLLRLDSLPLNAADGSFNLALLEPGFFGTSLFQPGAADSAAAVQTLGGAIDLEWWRPARETPSAASVTVGSDGLVRVVGRSAVGASYDETTKRTSPLWTGAVGLTRSDGWRPHSAQERIAAAGRAEWVSASRLSHSLSLYVARADLRIPGPLTVAGVWQDPSAITAAAVVDQPRRTTDLARAVYQARWPATGLEAALGIQAMDDDFRQLRANGVARTRGGDVLGRVAGGWYLGDVKWTAGLAATCGERTQERWANAGGRAGALFADLQLSAGTASGWLDATWKPHRLVTVTGGVSALAARRAADGTATAEGRFTTTALAPHLEIAASPSNRRLIEAFVRAERGAEAPTFDDLLAVRGTAPNLALGWTPLRIQTADTVAVGVRGRFGQPVTGADWISFELTAYAADWHDELLRLANPSGAPRGTVNAGTTRHRGVESQLRWRLLDTLRLPQGWAALDLTVTHTWSDARFNHDPVYGDRRLAGLPPHVGSAQLVFAAQQEGPFAALGASWVAGTTYADHANTLGFAGYTLANAQLGWKARRWTASLAVANLFDRRYIASTAGVLDLARTPATTALFLPGNPRSFTATFEWRW